MLDVMLDLETMGVESDAAIIAIGAVEFDMTTLELGQPFYAVVDFKSSIQAGCSITPETVMWWMQQSDEARKAVHTGGIHLNTVLSGFSKWLRGCGEHKYLRIWGNGANFDNVILANAYKKAGMVLPWMWYNDRCYRTMKEMYRYIPQDEFEGERHYAFADAKHQAKHLIKIQRTINNMLKGEDHGDS